MKRLFCSLIVLIFLLSACGGTSEESAQTEETAASATASTLGLDTEEMFTDRDLEVGYDEANSTAITLNGDSIQCDSGAVTVEGTTATITEEGIYILSGSLDDGMIIVDASDAKIQLVLNNVTIHSETSAAIYVRDAEKVFITLAQDSQNQLSNGGSYEAIDENNIDAVIFSKDDLTLNGLGALTIQAEAGHGVVSKNDLVITSGEYQIRAEKKGLSAEDSIRIADGSLTITSGTDGIHVEHDEDEDGCFLYIAGGSFDITAEGDGISSADYLQIDGGSFQILAGGGSANGTTHTDDFSWGAMEGGMNRGADAADAMMPGTAPDGTAPDDAPPDGTAPDATETDTTESETTETDATETDTTSTKGIKAAGDLLVLDGEFQIDSADDGIHSNSSLTINGGTYEISTGDDGFHADGALSISSGTICISESYEGLEGLTIDISGGEIQIVASDDGLNAAGGTDSSGFGGGMDAFDTDSDAAITISGGKLVIDADGDGIDSNGTLTITGGEIYVDGPTSGGDAPVDFGISAEISGGTLLAVGSSQMLESFEDSSTQGIVTIQVDSQEAGSTVTLTDSTGQELLSWVSAKTFDCVIISCPELADGESYTLTAGSYEETFTMDSLVYGSVSGAMGGMQGMGDPPDQGDFTPPDGETIPDGAPMTDGEGLPESDGSDGQTGETQSSAETEGQQTIT